MCPSHSTVRGILGELMAEADRVTVTDMDAGLEHLSRGTVKHVDILLIVVEPYYRSLETAFRTHNLARELGIERDLVVANKVRTPRDEEAIREFCQRNHLNIIAAIPYDEQLIEAERLGKSPLDHDACDKGIAEILRLAQVLQTDTPPRM